MLDAVRRFEEGAGRSASPHRICRMAKLRSYQGIVPKTEDWRMLGASDEEKTPISTGMEEDETDREMVAAAE